MARAGHRLTDPADAGQNAPELPDLIMIARQNVDWTLSELFDQLNQRPGWQQIPRLVLVADPAPVAVAAALRAGADDATGPTAPLDEIVARIGSVLRRRWATAAESPAEPLAGGLNPARFTVRLQEEVARATRYSLSFALVQAEIADFDGRLGELGDVRAQRLVGDTGDVLRTVLRVPDFAARTGQAAFAIALPETDQDGAAAWINRWRRALDLRLGGSEQRVTIHAGQSTLPQPVAPNAAELLASAGADLERARRIGD